MARWQDVLRTARPEPLSAEEVAAIRRATIAAASFAAQPVARRGPAAWIIGSALTTAVAGALFVAASTPRVLPQAPQPTPGVAPVVKQLQFATPGGTRIIWHFNPSFTLQETLP